MQKIKVKCPAKVNLTLEILNKREDGFHNIQSIMQTIDLFDILTIKIEKSDKFEIKLSGTSDEIPYDEKNLVYKAASLFAKTFPRPFGERVRVRGKYKNIYDQKTLKKAKELRKNITDAEQILWYCLRNRQLNNLKFRRQVPIDKYIADFVCKEKKLIIELDGSGHFETKQIKHDLKRKQFLESEGYTIIRFVNTDIFKDLEGVIEAILNTLENPLTPTLSPQGRGKQTICKAPPLASINPQFESFTISIHIEKNIPVAAGLAGGSTDAAGALWGLNKLFNNILSTEELHALCAKLGSDLNFCLEGGCQLATSRGELLEKLPGKEFHLSLIKPKNLGISAKEAYTKFANLENKPNLDMTSKLVNALKTGNANIQDFLHNDLEIALIQDYKELKTIKTAYPQSLMSGSGSTFFILEEKNLPLTEFANARKDSHIANSPLPQGARENIGNNFWVKTGLKSISYGVTEV